MPSEYTGQDRRKAKRAEITLSVIVRKNEPLEVRLRTSDQESLGTMVDLSPDGMAVLVDADIADNTVLWIRFTMAKVDNARVGFYGRVEVLGQVRNKKNVDENIYRLGIYFTDLDAPTRQRINEFIQLINSEKK